LLLWEKYSVPLPMGGGTGFEDVLYHAPSHNARIKQEKSAIISKKGKLFLSLYYTTSYAKRGLGYHILVGLSSKIL
jgi:hypothetical protein